MPGPPVYDISWLVSETKLNCRTRDQNDGLLHLPHTSTMETLVPARRTNQLSQINCESKPFRTHSPFTSNSTKNLPVAVLRQMLKAKCPEKV